MRQRVISYTNREETPSDIADIYQEALTKSPDVIKLAVMARTPEEAWPLVQILAKATVPTVILGLGKPGIMLTMLGQKLGAPWAYAALERGMESYPGQPTVQDLNETYHYPSVNKSTRLIGVTGFEEADRATVAALNAAFVASNLPARCLPLGVGSMKLFGKVIDAVKLAAVVVDASHRRAILKVATELDPTAAQSRSADLMLHKGDKWHAYDTHSKVVVDALEAAARAKHPGDQPLKGRFTLIVGANDTALTMAEELKQREAALIVASHDRAAGQRVAQLAEARAVPFEALYTTMHDIVVVCDDEREHTSGKSALRASYLKPGMTVLDLTASVRPNEFVREAMARGCAVVMPRALWLDQVVNQARMLTGKEVARRVLEDAVRWLNDDIA